jgi:signal transduction histidine kinase
MVSTPSAEVRGAVGHRPPILPVLAFFAVALSAGVVILTLAAASEHRVTAAVVNGLLVGVPMGVGLVSLSAQPGDRFAALLVGCGAAFSLTALSQSHDSLLYSAGRVSVWLVEPTVIFLMLAFPSGQLTGRWDRVLMYAVLGLVAALYLPTALMVDHYPEPAPFVTCGTDCPANAFTLFNVDIDAVIRPLREILTVLAVFGVTVSVAHRMRHSGTMMRLTLAPVLAVASFQVVVYAMYLWARKTGPLSDTLRVLGWIYILSLPAIALGFAAGLLNRRLHVAAVLQRLTSRLRAPAGTGALQRGLADALEDPSLQIVYWLPGDPGRWVDETGWPVKAPAEKNGRKVSRVAMDGRLVAAVIHDRTLAPDPKLVQAAATYVLTVLENTRLIGEVRASMQQVSEAERRTAIVAEGERRKIERDLHDGAQQQLRALRINVAMVAERLNGESPARAQELQALGDQIEQTIAEVRLLSQGAYPSLLARRGLVVALRAAADDAPVPTIVKANGIPRFSPQVESAVYFSCLEALQNALKHARGADGVTIGLEAGARLRFEVSDDGPGFSQQTPQRGAGLANISERLASVGGWLSIDSAPGRGTRIVGTIPIG